MNAIGILVLFGSTLVVLFAQRRWALLAMMVVVLYLTQGQQLNVLGFNLYAFRLLELAGFIRVIVRGDLKMSKLCGLDWTLLALYLYSTLVFLLRSWFCLRSADGPCWQ
jgi:hypothetical protein